MSPTKLAPSMMIARMVYHNGKERQRNQVANTITDVARARINQYQ
jgi:hypothetical protein